MGWYLRRSIKIGPFRINASKSGLGLSAGVKGSRRVPPRAGGWGEATRGLVSFPDCSWAS